MSFFTSELILRDADLIAEGGERWVYQHPDYPDCIFKLQKPASARVLKNNMKGRSIRWFPSLANRIVHREYAAYLKACLAPQGDIDTLPVNKLYGFAGADIGFVQISEKVSLDGLTPGPTLAQLHSDGALTVHHIDLLNIFVKSFLDWGIPTNDISRRNIVLGKRNDREMFIAVDGFGDIKAVPLATFSARVRRQALARRCDRLAQRIDKEFDPVQFCFR